MQKRPQIDSSSIGVYVNTTTKLGKPGPELKAPFASLGWTYITPRSIYMYETKKKVYDTYVKAFVILHIEHVAIRNKNT
jgi:hypothetical protein